MDNQFFKEGRSADYEGEYDPEEVKKGIEIESEHSSDPEIKLKITHDHLVEFKNYNTWLLWMEDLMRKYDLPSDYEEDEEKMRTDMMLYKMQSQLQRLSEATGNKLTGKNMNERLFNIAVENGIKKAFNKKVCKNRLE